MQDTNTLLYGKNAQKNIVKIEQDKNDIIEYIQTEIGTIENRIRGYKPLIYKHDTTKKNTHGNNHYNNITRVSSIDKYYKFYRDREKYLRQYDTTTGYITSAYMTDTGKTLFKGLTLDTIHYLSIDIESMGLEYSKAKVNIDRMDMISPLAFLPKALDKHKRTVDRYFKTNSTVSISELKKTVDDGNIYLDTYLEFFRGLLVSKLITDMGDHVLMASMDTIKESCIIYDKDEKEFLIKFLNKFHEMDVNILLGYNSNEFDIPYLMYRCWVHGIEFNLGRNGSQPRGIVSSMRVEGGKTQKFLNWHIYGRNNLDLMWAVKKFDFTDRKLENYKLKDVMSTYELEEDGRLVLSFEEIKAGLLGGEGTPEYEKVYQYCLDDSKDLIRLLKYVGQADFYLTQMIPINYDTLVFAGNVTRINALMIRDYINNKYSMPMWKEYMDKEDVEEGTVFKYIVKESKKNDFLIPDELYEIINKKETSFEVKSVKTGKAFNLDYKWLDTFKLDIQGAEVQADDTGVFKNVGDSDISSMYPSIMINYKVFPKMDELNTMERTLVALRAMRFDMKKKMKELSKGSIEYNVANGQQLAYKIFLNSAFGALSSNGFYFKDSYACAMVTKYGRGMILEMRDKLIEMGYKITALDTDGLSYTNGQPIDVDKINSVLESLLPDGIGVETEIFDTIIVFARKTYYAQYHNGDYKIRGAALTARSAPMFYRRFVKRMCYLLSNANYDAIKALYNETIRQIKMNEMPIDEFSMLKSVNKTVDKYKHDLEEYFKLKGQLKGTQQVYELAIKTNRYIQPGEKLGIYHKLVEVKKEPSTKKKDITDVMDTLFNVPDVMIKEDALGWSDEYANDLNPEYYIKLLNNKLEKLLHKTFDEKKQVWRGILSESIYKYIIGDSLLNKICDFKYIDTTMRENDFFGKWERVNIDNVIDMVKEQNTDQFTTIQQFENSEKVDGESVYHPLYFDFDSDNLEESFTDAKLVYSFFRNILKINPDYIMVWFSGGKGFHIEVKPQLFKISPMPDLQLINKEIAQYLIDTYKIKTLDMGSIYSTRRMWRLAYSIHSKSNIPKTWIYNFEVMDDIDDVMLWLSEITDYSEEIDKYIKHLNKVKGVGYVPELQEWMKTFYDRFYVKRAVVAMMKPKHKYNAMAGKYPKCIISLLTLGIRTSGERNKATTVLATYFKESGKTQEEAVEIITEWTMGIPEHLTSIRGESNIRNNVKTVVSSAYKSKTYSFQCYYICSVLKGTGFRCPSNCKLAE